MSSTSVSSSPTPEPTPRSPALIPQVNLTALAKTTRKTLERLVPFSHMRPSSSEASPRLTKIINKVNRYTGLIDSSMLCEQLGYQLANNCMILCDPELSVGLSAPGGKKNAGLASPTRGRGAWTPVGVSGQPGSTDACVFGREDARELAGKGHEIALKVKEGFDGITQEMYKIAASTKDDMLVVLVPPDPTHSETLKISLKDVGTNLVANLSLLSEFSKAVAEVADWWSSVKDDLALEDPSLLVPTSTQYGDEEGIGNIEGKTFAWWSEMKDGFQEYYDVINVVHLRFPELLPLSSVAWQSVALARSQTPSSAGHSNIPHQSNPVLTGVSESGANGHGKCGCLGSFRLGWKRVDKEKKEEERKPRKKLVKRKQSREKRDGNKKMEEVKGKTNDRTEETEEKTNGTPKLNETETGNGNNTSKESSQNSSSIHSDSSRSSTSSTSPNLTKEEKPDTKVRMMKRSSTI
ncbi:hypothetical protein BYT27DRAFT_6476430 [Phlegmacium glaucopus]|nr:hypothetical protein BYT27DRAFT_6476430 [Phlegmacium glaucopus]